MLVGVVEHAGSMSGGHYTSFSARDPSWHPPPQQQPSSSPEKDTAAAPKAAAACNGGVTGQGGAEKSGECMHARAGRGLDAQRLQWFRASDSRVSPAAWEAVAACEAYILMYVRTR